MATNEIPTPEQPRVAAAPNAIIGDRDPRDADVEVNVGTVPAQVVGPEPVPVEEVPVHEVAVRMDEPASEVQIPDAGRGSTALPIHDVAGQRPEEAFAEASKSAKKS